jgi:hypothetical protein
MYADLCFRPAFDYNGDCFHYYFEDFMDDGIPDILEPVDYYLYEDDYGRLLSMYFEYSLNQDYVVKLTQGLKVSDILSVQPYYKRILSTIAHNTTLLNKTGEYIRKLLTSGNNHAPVINHIGYKRAAISNCEVNDTTSRLRKVFSFISDTLRVNSILKFGRSFIGYIADNVQLVASNFRQHRVSTKIQNNIKVTTAFNSIVCRSRKIVTNVKATDYARMPFVFIRKIIDTISSLDNAGHIGDYIRGLVEQAANIAEAKRTLTIIVTQTDDISVHCSLLRRLSIFIKIVTSSFIRDYVIRRFLIARDEIIIKSAIKRELELDSKIR